MPFPFSLPTTSSTSLTEYFNSPSHPSLILTATTHRSVLRDALKKHKRLPPASQASHLSTVLGAVTSYLPFLLIIYSSVTDRILVRQADRVNISPTRELVVEWRSTVSSSAPGRETARIKLKGLHNELLFVLQTLAYTYTLLARTYLHSAITVTSATPDQRAAPITTGMRYLLDAQSIHFYISSLPSADGHLVPLDTSTSTSSALASLALAEATLTVVTKDDPYAAAVALDRDKDSKDWMVSAPSIPKVRAHLFARLCTATADHAAKAAGLLARSAGAGRVDEALVKYAEDLRRTARAKAARFLGIDAEISGNTGEGIAWLRGARRELGLAVSEDDGGKRKGFKGLKQSWSERREDRRMEKGDQDWGMDAGRLEEARVIEWLEAKWVKSNDTISVQTIPPFEPLLSSMPSGRECHTPKQYTPPALDANIVAQMRAPLDPSERAFTGNEDDSGDESHGPGDPVGAFPGTSSTYY